MRSWEPGTPLAEREMKDLGHSASTLVQLIHRSVHLLHGWGSDVTTLRYKQFWEIDSFGWYNDTVKNSSITTKHLYFILTFRSHHDLSHALQSCVQCRVYKQFCKHDIVHSFVICATLISKHYLRLFGRWTVYVYENVITYENQA